MCDFIFSVSLDVCRQFMEIFTVNNMIVETDICLSTQGVVNSYGVVDDVIINKLDRLISVKYFFLVKIDG